MTGGLYIKSALSYEGLHVILCLLLGVENRVNGPRSCYVKVCILYEIG